MSGPDRKVFNPAGTRRVVVAKGLPGARWFELLVAADCRVDVAQGRTCCRSWTHPPHDAPSIVSADELGLARWPG
jgi:hypothetical protein